MAEKVTIAEITIDERGVVTGMARGTAAIKGGEVALNSAGVASARTAGFFTLLTGRMFSLRVAALAVGRALGLAGLLTGITFAVVGLVKELVTSTDWFQRAKGAISDWWQELVHGENALGRLTRHMSDFQKAAGFPSTLDTIEQLRVLEEQFSKTFGERAGTVRGGALFQALTIDLENLSRKINTLIADLIKLGFGRGEILGLTGGIVRPVPSGPGPDLFKEFGIVTPDKMREVISLARQAVRAFTEVGKAEPLFPLGQALESITKKLEQMGLSLEQIELLGLRFTSVTVSTASLSKMIEELSRSLSVAQIQFDVILTAAQQFAQSFGAALEGQSTTFKGFMADMLRSIGYTLLAWGALGLVTSLFGYAPGAKAAGIALAAGAAALLLAGQLAPAGRGAGGGGFTEAAAVGAGGTTQNITVIIEGRAITDDQARDITDSVARALRRGQQGGRL